MIQFHAGIILFIDAMLVYVLVSMSHAIVDEYVPVSRCSTDSSTSLRRLLAQILLHIVEHL